MVQEKFFEFHPHCPCSVVYKPCNHKLLRQTTQTTHSDLHDCVDLHTKGVLKVPSLGLVVMWFEIHQDLAEDIVQSPRSPAVHSLQNLLDLCHCLPTLMPK